MPRPKDPDAPAQAVIHPSVRGAIEHLQQGLKTEGVAGTVSLSDLASALVMYTPPQQAAGMLAAYTRHIASLEKKEASPGKSAARDG